MYIILILYAKMFTTNNSQMAFKFDIYHYDYDDNKKIIFTYERKYSGTFIKFVVK